MEGFLRQKKADGIMSRWPTQHLPAWVTVAFWTSWLLVRHTKNCIAIDASADTISTLSGKLGALPGITTKTFTPKHNSAAYRNLSGCCRDFKSEKAKTAAVSRNQGNPRVFRTQNIKHGIPSIILCSGSAPGFFSAILRVSGSGLCFTASFLLR